jgi:HSP20 family protein
MTLVRFKNNTHRNYFPSIFDSFFNEEFFTPEKRAFVPATNVRETEAAYHLDLIAPGFEKEHFNITIENGMLQIGAEVKSENVEQDKAYTRKEYYFQSFKRTFSLPENIDEGGIQAKYENGILKIELPKMATKALASKTININ